MLSAMRVLNQTRAMRDEMLAGVRLHLGYTMQAIVIDRPVQERLADDVDELLDSTKKDS